MTDTLRAALFSIPADDRETWVMCAMALKSEMGEAGFDLWDAWSRQSEAYKAGDAKAVWRSVKPTGGVTVASLYHEAKQRGWQGEALVIAPPDPAEQRRRAEVAAAEEASRERAAQRAVQVATKMLGEAELLPHSYLATKGFLDAQGLVIAKDNLLLLPMRGEANGEVQSLQTITPDGQKRFLPGGKAKGAVFNLGRHSTRWYVEGYATGLSVQAALRRMYRDDQVVVCFSAGNLGNVANPRGDSPRSRYVIADNDESGTGQRYAEKTGLPYWMPPESGDANDWHQKHGIEALADALREVLIA